MYCVGGMLFFGLGRANAGDFAWIWFASLQALATMVMREKVTAAMQGKLLPSLPGKKMKRHRQTL